VFFVVLLYCVDLAAKFLDLHKQKNIKLLTEIILVDKLLINTNVFFWFFRQNVRCGKGGTST
jgi:hypothetical protein